jgi:hypothetical protein
VQGFFGESSWRCYLRDFCVGPHLTSYRNTA